MKIELINVSLPTSFRDEVQSLAKGYGTDIAFEDVLGYRDSVLLNASLVGDAFKVAKVHAEIARLEKGGYFVRDIASGVVGSTHDIVEDKGMRYARDLIKYSEHDIEKIVRTGLEVSGAKHVLVITKSNVLITSRIWQRISAEVAVDYEASVDFVEIEDFILGFNLYTEKYGLILADSLLGDILKNFLVSLGEVKCTFYASDMEAFYTTNGSLSESALAIYEIIKEKNSDFAAYAKEYFDKFIS